MGFGAYGAGSQRPSPVVRGLRTGRHGGMGMGIDRLLMAITGLGIRETILFPLVK